MYHPPPAAGGVISLPVPTRPITPSPKMSPCSLFHLFHLSLLFTKGLSQSEKRAKRYLQRQRRDNLPLNSSFLPTDQGEHKMNHSSTADKKKGGRSASISIRVAFFSSANREREKRVNLKGTKSRMPSAGTSRKPACEMGKKRVD